VAAPSGYVAAWVIGDDGRLYELYYNNAGPNWPWTDHGAPAAFRGQPAALAGPLGYVGIFVAAAERLFERYYNNGWLWTDHGNPGVLLYSSPATVATNYGYIGAFLAGGDGILYENYFNNNGPYYRWSAHPR
jgi:hypothetical protein